MLPQTSIRRTLNCLPSSNTHIEEELFIKNVLVNDGVDASQLTVGFDFFKLFGDFTVGCTPSLFQPGGAGCGVGHRLIVFARSLLQLYLSPSSMGIVMSTAFPGPD